MKKLEIENLKFKYDEKEVLKGVNLSLNSNEIISIIGSSGSGKSTLLNCLALITNKFTCDKFSIGNEEVLKKSLKEMRAYRLQNIGIIFQDYNLILEYTVMDNITSIMKFAKLKIDNEKILEVLKDLEIDKLKDKKVFNLSGGEKQRVSIARAILLEPEIILADEPTGALDYDNTINVFKVLKEQSIKRNLPLIIVTHDLNVANMCDKVYELKQGKLEIK